MRHPKIFKNLKMKKSRKSNKKLKNRLRWSGEKSAILSGLKCEKNVAKVIVQSKIGFAESRSLSISSDPVIWHLNMRFVWEKKKVFLTKKGLRKMSKKSFVGWWTLIGCCGLGGKPIQKEKKAIWAHIMPSGKNCDMFQKFGSSWEATDNERKT